eukprot:m51a1_g4110 putative ethanolamine ammonia-lyase (759) ;mRNA; r:126073-128485
MEPRVSSAAGAAGAPPGARPRFRPLDTIAVPPPAPADERYSLCLPFTGETVEFAGLKQLLAYADVPKRGDARIAPPEAADDVRREAARTVLAGLTLRHLYDRPLPDPRGCIDDVMRVNYDIDLEEFARIENWTVGELKDRILAGMREEEAVALRRSLTGVMAAAVTKLMDVHELVFAARSLPRVVTRARTELGRPGTLSSRLQPNHQIDDEDGMALLTYAGLSLGAGDCLIGINPAIDNVANITRVLRAVDGVRRALGAPTQICVLAHVRTQLGCLAAGAPVDLVFQSIAGTDACMREFDIDVALLDTACQAALDKGSLAREAGGAYVPNVMYYETGQGSAASLDADNGVDMTTCEALAYGLARRYDPFMVNSVTGFIGPETHRTSHELVVSALQDNFCGKLLGLQMGMDPCWTLHSEISLEAQQMATELLAAAGTAYFIDVYLGVDRMLGYFTTSGHDNETLREIHGLRPQAEFAEWAVRKRIYEAPAGPAGALRRGPMFGRPAELFAGDPAQWLRMLAKTPCAYGFESAGPRPADAVARAARLGMALSRRAVRTELDMERIACAFDDGDPPRVLRTLAADKSAHLADNKLGARLVPEDAELLRSLPGGGVWVVVSDGLSADAVHSNLPVLLPELRRQLGARGVALERGRTIVVRYGRVKLSECVGEAARAEVIVCIVGERPGGDTMSSRSLSAYLALRKSAAVYEYTVVNSIYPNSPMPPERAAARVAQLVELILRFRCAGNKLNRLVAERGIALV